MEDRQRPKPTGTNRPTQTHTPTPPTHTKDRGAGQKGAHHTPPTRGDPHRARTRVHYADHHQPTPTPEQTAAGAGRPQPPTTPQSNTRTTHPTTRLGGHSGEATPGPIPNPEAKTPSANGTAPARTRKSRTPPSTHHPPTTHKNGGKRGGNKQQHNNAGSRDLSPTTGRLIQKQIPPQPKDHIHVPGQARQSVALPQCTLSWRSSWFPAAR